MGKFHHYAIPDMGEIRHHYGRANDPKTYEYVTHGLKSGDKPFVIIFFNSKKFLKFI